MNKTRRNKARRRKRWDRIWPILRWHGHVERFEDDGTVWLRLVGLGGDEYDAWLDRSLINVPDLELGDMFSMCVDRTTRKPVFTMNREYWTSDDIEMAKEWARQTMDGLGITCDQVC